MKDHKDKTNLIRLQKILADRGVGSRRYCEKLITQGRVKVDNKIITKLGSQFNPQKHTFLVDNTVQPEKKQNYYIILNKPLRIVCTKKDPQKRKTVMDLLPKELQACHPVGRLDLNSEGLVLLTNDGALTFRITHPRYGVWKRYRVWIKGKITDKDIEKLQKGVMIFEGKTLPAQVQWLGYDNKLSELIILIHEGKKRQIRRMTEAIGFRVSRLRREAIGPIELGNLAYGQFRHLTPTEITQILKLVHLPYP